MEENFIDYIKLHLEDLLKKTKEYKTCPILYSCKYSNYNSDLCDSYGSVDLEEDYSVKTPCVNKLFYPKGGSENVFFRKEIF
jgi:hypothetical protein